MKNAPSPWFFISGQAWLLVALALHLGRHYERSSPEMVSFFGLGRWYDPLSYTLVNLIVFLFGVALFIMAWRPERSAP